MPDRPRIQRRYHGIYITIGNRLVTIIWPRCQKLPRNPADQEATR